VLQLAIDIEAAALLGQEYTGYTRAVLDVDKGLAHLLCPGGLLFRVQRLAVDPADFVETGVDQGFPADGAAVGQFESKGLGEVNWTARAPQFGVVDGETEPAEVATANQRRLWQLFAPTIQAIGLCRSSSECQR